jgi:hypothetical protein
MPSVRRLNTKQVPAFAIVANEGFVAKTYGGTVITEANMSANSLILYCAKRTSEYIADATVYVNGQLYVPATVVYMPDNTNHSRVKISNYIDVCAVGTDLDVILMWRKGINPNGTAVVELTPVDVTPVDVMLTNG